MSTALGLAMQISANTAQLSAAVKDINQKLNSMGEAGKKAASDLAILRTIEIGEIALGAVKLATEAFLELGNTVASTLRNVTSFANQVGKQLDALNDVSARTGIGVEALQAYALAARETGVSTESFIKSIQGLTVAIGQATIDESKQEQFKKLGIVFADLKAQTPEEQFETVADAVSRIADESQRAAVLKDIFGQGGIGLSPLFSEGPGFLKQMVEEAKSLNLIVSENSVKAIDRMYDAFGKVGQAISSLVGQVLGELAGPITQIANDLLGVIQAAAPKQLAETIASQLISFIQLAGNAFFELAKFIEAFVKKYAPILGLDVRSNAERQLQELTAERDRAAALAASGGQTAVQRLAAGLPFSVTVEDIRAAEARVAQLNNQIASIQAGAGGLSLAQFQANFNAALTTAQTSLTTRLSGNVDAVATQEDQLEEQRRTNRLLEQQATTPVEIAGGG